MSRTDTATVERYLHEHIPLSAAMGLRVVTASPERVRLRAPLAPNVNHRRTVFGGSAAALATLAAWTLLHLRSQAAGLDTRLVVQRNEMSFEAPIPGDFEAVCELADEALWERFRATFERRGRARIALGSEVLYEGRRAAVFRGEFVALPGTEPHGAARAEESAK